jgi:Adenylate and Guanylate cyclase catalytic domain
MDYTIIGSALNLTARLQSHAEIDGILLGHETYSLVKDEIAAEEHQPIKVKGFAEPVRCYKVLGLYDDLAAEGSVIREESDGFKVLLDLQKRDRPRPSPRSKRSSTSSRVRARPQQAGGTSSLAGRRRALSRRASFKEAGR